MVTRQQSVVFPQSSYRAVPQRACEPAGQHLSSTLNSSDLINCQLCSSLKPKFPHSKAVKVRSDKNIDLFETETEAFWNLISLLYSMLNMCHYRQSLFSHVFTKGKRLRCSPMSFTIHPKQVKLVHKLWCLTQDGMTVSEG